jgi:hypothetical protein
VLAKLGVNKNKRRSNNAKFQWNIYYFLSFVVLSIFIGTRDGLGVDFHGYVNAYETSTQPFIFGESSEIGNIWLIELLKSLNLNYKSYFIATALITIFLFFKSFQNSFRLLPIAILVFFIGGTFDFVINGIRQSIAIMAFFNALRFINREIGSTKKKSEFYQFFYLYRDRFTISLFNTIFYPHLFYIK